MMDMKNRVFWALNSVGALLLGATIYLLFREGTYIHSFLSFSAFAWAESHFFGAYILRYYASDFLWTYSLCCALYAVVLPRRRGGIVLALCSGGLGIVWEILQWSDRVQGTGDMWDCLTYGLAAIVAIYINIRKEGK